jgi:hypothetical protein
VVVAVVEVHLEVAVAQALAHLDAGWPDSDLSVGLVEDAFVVAVGEGPAAELVAPALAEARRAIRAGDLDLTGP